MAEESHEAESPAADVSYEETAEQGEVVAESATQEVAHEEPEVSVPDYGVEIESLRGQIGEMSQSVNALVQTLAQERQQKAQAATKQPEVTDTQIQQMWNEGRYLEAADLIAERKVRASQQQVVAQSQRDRWDDKAKREFPINDKVFRSELEKVWAQRTADGMTDPNSPTALYDVAQITALKLDKKSQPKQAKSAPSAEAPRQAPPKREKLSVSEDHASVKLFRQLYDGDPGKLEEATRNFRAKLGSRSKRRR